ncbi:peptidoglycan-binding domain-containing protein [Jiella marina]|uniref:peptidoglycan-binding domain-containing protein n=1 Tax=Jiella sp. LLJ827 TaxID=2917712 RepID=UPI002100DAA8|nr:peptidoglycan-binding protein [Jiella sp. LLJ827]
MKSARDGSRPSLAGGLAALAGRTVGGFGRVLARRPGRSAGIAAFVAVFGSVTANALFAQPGRHPNPMLATRLDASAESRQDVAAAPSPVPLPGDRPDLQQTASIAETDPPAPAAAPAAAVSVPDESTDIPESETVQKFASLSRDEVVRRIQSALTTAQVAELKADGIPGERTRAAIRTFEALEGMEVTGEPDLRLLERLAEIGLVE